MKEKYKAKWQHDEEASYIVCGVAKENSTSRKVSVSAHGVEKKSTGGVYEEQQVSALLK